MFYNIFLKYGVRVMVIGPVYDGVEIGRKARPQAQFGERFGTRSVQGVPLVTY